MPNRMGWAQPLLISLFDYSGVWSQPYKNTCYVYQIDIQYRWDIFDSRLDDLLPDGVLAASPCTDFSGSGAQWWPGKDESGETEKSIALVNRAMDLIDKWQPKFWALENPTGRIERLCPRIGEKKYSYHPYFFGDPYRKYTHLWGNFNTDLKQNKVEPEGIRKGQPDEWYSKVGGKSLATKNYRSRTSVGFACAFYEANPL